MKEFMPNNIMTDNALSSHRAFCALMLVLIIVCSMLLGACLARRTQEQPEPATPQPIQFRGEPRHEAPMRFWIMDQMPDRKASV